ncbi:Neuropeptide FF receptor 2 [Tyrophagus putrescentiae]|nr:Neuropeptide FF receptor 2 [Tyrophagus putrescentiae]
MTANAFGLIVKLKLSVILVAVGVLWAVAILSHLILLRILFTKRLLARLRLPYAGSRPPMVTVLLTQLTVADLASLLFTMPFLVYHNFFNDWPFGEVLCRLAPFIGSLANVLDLFSLLALLLLAHDLVVKSHRPKTSSGKFACLLTSIWTLALVTSLPLLLFLSVHKYEYYNFDSEEEEDRYWQDLEMLEAVRVNQTQTASGFSTSTTTTEKTHSELVIVHYCAPTLLSYPVLARVSYELSNLLQHILPLISLGVLALKTFCSSESSLSNFSSSKRKTLSIAHPVSDRERAFAAAISWASLLVALLWVPIIFFHLLVQFFLVSHLVYVLWHFASLATQLGVFFKPAVYLLADSHFRELFKEVLYGFVGVSYVAGKIEPLSIVNGHDEEGVDDTDEQLRYDKFEDTVEIV